MDFKYLLENYDRLNEETLVNGKKEGTTPPPPAPPKTDKSDKKEETKPDKKSSDGDSDITKIAVYTNDFKKGKIRSKIEYYPSEKRIVCKDFGFDGTVKDFREKVKDGFADAPTRILRQYLHEINDLIKRSKEDN